MTVATSWPGQLWMKFPESRVSGKFPGPEGQAAASYRESRFRGTSFRSLVLELNLSLDLGRLAGHYIGLVAPFSRGHFGSLVSLRGTRGGVGAYNTAILSDHDLNCNEEMLLPK
jgi:hypothetical protein